MSMRGLLCVRPADTHSTQGQVTLRSLLRPIPRVTTCNQRWVTRQPAPSPSQAVYHRGKRPQMRVTFQRESSSEFRPKARLALSRRMHLTTPFWHLKVKKGSAPVYQGQAKSKRGEWVKQCEILVPGSNPKAQSSSHQRPTVSLQGRR